MSLLVYETEETKRGMETPEANSDSESAFTVVLCQLCFKSKMSVHLNIKSLLLALRFANNAVLLPLLFCFSLVTRAKRWSG